MKKITIRVQDQYNQDKVYLVKVYNCGHIYMNQEIKGKTIYPRWVKTTKANLKEFIGIDIYKNTKTPSKVLDCTRLQDGNVEMVLRQD